MERSDREMKEEVFDKDNMLESKTTQDCCLSLQPSKRLESHYFTLTIFRNLGVFFVSFLLLYYCFVILITYSRAQRGKKLSPAIISPSVALELNGYLSDLRFSFVFAL